MVSLSSRLLEAASKRTTQQVVLHCISWQTYQALLTDLGNQRSTRLAYDHGVLEITKALFQDTANGLARQFLEA